MTDDKIKDAEQFLRGSSFLEEEIFQLYQNLAQKTEYEDIRYMLIGLAYDSLKHSKILAEIGKHFVSLKTIPQLSQKVNELSREISEKEKMNTEDLSTFVKRAADLEDLLSEKYIALLALENLQYVVNKLSRMTPVDIRALRSVFSGLVKDKENHRNLLIEFQYFVIAKKSEKARDTPPFTKYQNPDKWNIQ
jgi:rubrerythrin